MPSPKYVFTASGQSPVIAGGTEESEYLCVQGIGTWTGTVVIQGSLNGVDWVGLQIVNLNTGTAVANFTANGLFRVLVSGIAYVRADVTFATGSIELIFEHGK